MNDGSIRAGTCMDVANKTGLDPRGKENNDEKVSLEDYTKQKKTKRRPDHVQE